MNRLKQQSTIPSKAIALRLPILAAAGILMASTWLPIVEIKGFDTFALKSVALWPGIIVRYTLSITALCLLLPSLQLSRWWMALSIGILFSPLLDIALRAKDLAEMMTSEDMPSAADLVIPLKGFWAFVIGFALWLIDLCLFSFLFLKGKLQAGNE